jgi:Cu/Zn superoxide dismutase
MFRLHSSKLFLSPAGIRGGDTVCTATGGKLNPKKNNSHARPEIKRKPLDNYPGNIPYRYLGRNGNAENRKTNITFLYQKLS